jgi:hypothetical protein
LYKGKTDSESVQDYLAKIDADEIEVGAKELFCPANVFFVRFHSSHSNLPFLVLFCVLIRFFSLGVFHLVRQFVNALKNGGAPFLAEPKPSIVDSIVDAFSSLTRPLRSLLFDGGRLFEARWLRWRVIVAQKIFFGDQSF